MSHVLTVAPVALVTLAAVAPPRRPRPAASVGFWLGYLANEFPFLVLCWLVASTLLALGSETPGSPAGLAILALVVLTACGLALIMWRGLLAGPVVARALSRDLGLGGGTDSSVGRAERRRLPVRAVLWPLPLGARGVQRIANVSYGPAGRRNRLDLYRHTSCPAGAPVLVHFHGGHFRMGGKSRESRALFYRLASHGWVCVSADYRLRRAGRFPASLIDAKRAIAWIHEHAPEYGGDPSLLVVAGSSAGAHLASMAALTANDPVFQPGFEHVDTTVSAAVCLYGYYGDRELGGPLPSSPRAYVRRDAPPFFVTHGDNDTLIPAASAESFVAALRGVSISPVVYAELPGAQHSFDLLHSVRFEHVIRGIEAFTAWIRGRRHSGAMYLSVVAIAAMLVLSACGGSSASPRATLTRYLADWGRGDWAAMRAQVLDPPADFTAVNSQVFHALGISHASFVAHGITTATSGGSAGARVSEHFTLAHVGVWSPVTAVRMAKRGGKWYVRWSPATVVPSLRMGRSSP